MRYLYIYIVGNEGKKIFTISQIESSTWKKKETNVTDEMFVKEEEKQPKKSQRQSHEYEKKKKKRHIKLDTQDNGFFITQSPMFNEDEKEVFLRISYGLLESLLVSASELFESSG